MPLDDCLRVSLLELPEELSEAHLLLRGAVVYALKDSLLGDDPTDVGDVDAHGVEALDSIRYLVLREELMDDTIRRDNIVVAWVLEASGLEHGKQGGDRRPLTPCGAVYSDVLDVSWVVHIDLILRA